MIKRKVRVCLMLLGTPLLFLYTIMVKQIYSLALCLVITLLVGCVEKPNLSDVVVLATPRNDSTLYTNERVRYQLQLFTINDYVDGLTVSSFDIERGRVVCLDTTFADKLQELDYDFIYTAPLFSKEEVAVELTFMVRDNFGNTSKVLRNVLVKKHQQLIEERNGIILYAHNASLPNALLLSDVSQPFILQDAPDSLQADIWLNPEDTTSGITWSSQTGIKFVRHNDFNYTAATAENLQTTYLSSKRYDAIREVSPNDIIIVGRDELVEGVFFVNNIISSDSFQGQCLQLSYKGVVNH